MVNVDSRKSASHGELISLREYVDMRFESQEKAVSAALAAADRAVTKAESSTERRLEGMNEFRTALNDYSRTLMPRAEAEKVNQDLKEKVDALTTRINARDERGQGRGELWGWIVGAVGVLLAAIAYFGGA